MTQYFAMLDDRCQGPFPLDRLREVGVSPNTYVWSKNMADWEKAIEVEEIRDYYFNILREKNRQKNQDVEINRKRVADTVDGLYKTGFLRFGMEFPMPEDNVDLDNPPVSYVVPAIISTLFCFPITGAMAIYYSIKSRREWENALRSESETSRDLYTPEERLECKKNAHYFERMAKMWIGITFFIGVIVYATVISQQ